MSNGLSSRIKSKNVFFLLGFLGLLIFGCARNGSTEFPTQPLDGNLILYSTATQKSGSGSVVATQIPKPNPTKIPLPTSTPFVYQVVENDTLTGIAFRHSVPLEELIAANPSIDPNFLTIGLTLTIPLDGVTSQILTTSTPVSLVIEHPSCYFQIDGVLQCMSVVENDQVYAVENVSVMISLQFPDGNDAISQIAIPPINIIPAGQKSAVVASFSSPLNPKFVAQSSLLSVIPVSQDDQRYFQSELQSLEIMISSDGQQASVSGLTRFLPEQSDTEQQIAETVWLVAFAYDHQNKIVGIRKWVANDLLLSGEWVNFDFVVYSLGQSIDYVELITELRP